MGVQESRAHVQVACAHIVRRDAQKKEPRTSRGSVRAWFSLLLVEAERRHLLLQHHGLPMGRELRDADRHVRARRRACEAPDFSFFLSCEVRLEAWTIRAVRRTARARGSAEADLCDGHHRAAHRTRQAAQLFTATSCEAMRLRPATLDEIGRAHV